jgi:DNA repair protein SbcD/Mre11
MKILHTADWHLGKKLDYFSRLPEQKEVMEEICEIAERESVDAVIISGDLFDNFNPSNEAVELFYKTLKKLTNNSKRFVLAIAGNHDSPERIEAPDPIARECGIFFAGYPNTKVQPCNLDSGIKIERTDEGFMEVLLPGCEYPLRIIITPYANEFRLKTFIHPDKAEEQYREIIEEYWKKLADRYCDSTGVNIISAHLYIQKKGEEAPEEPEDERPILHVGGAQPIFSESVPQNIQYVALGHIHRSQTIDKVPCPIIYSGSPLAYSFSEASQDKLVVLLEAEPGKPVKYSRIKLKSGKRLLRKTFSSIPMAVEWLKENKNALIELTVITEKFLSGEEKKMLLEANEGIIAIIPEVKDKDFLEAEKIRHIDLSKSNEELFKEYFKFKTETLPNDRLINLFKELQAQKGEKNAE